MTSLLNTLHSKRFQSDLKKSNFFLSYFIGVWKNLLKGFTESDQKVFIFKHGSKIIIYSYFCCKLHYSRGQGPPQANFHAISTCDYPRRFSCSIFLCFSGSCLCSVRAYIHYHIEDLGTSEIKGMYMSKLMGESEKIKPTYKHIEDLGLTSILYIPKFEVEIIR